MSCTSQRLIPRTKWTVTASKPRMLCLTHLLLRPPLESGSQGTDKLCLGKSDLMGAGRLQAATAPSGLGNKLNSMCLSGRGNSTFPSTLVWRRSQYGTEQGLARDDCSEGARLNTAVSGISKACEEERTGKATGTEEERDGQETGGQKGRETEKDKGEDGKCVFYLKRVKAHSLTSATESVT